MATSFLGSSQGRRGVDLSLLRSRQVDYVLLPCSFSLHPFSANLVASERRSRCLALLNQGDYTMITYLFEKKYAEYIKAIEAQYYARWYYNDHANYNATLTDPDQCEIPF